MNTRPPDEAAASSQAPSGIPEWVLRRVDDAITEHFFKMEAKIEQINHKMSEQAQASSKSLNKVQDVYGQLGKLVQVTIEEQKRGQERDKQIVTIKEQLADAAKHSKAGAPRADAQAVLAAPSPSRDAQAQIGVFKDEVTEMSGKTQAKVSIVEKDMLTLRHEIECLVKRMHVMYLQSCIFTYSAVELPETQRKRANEEILRKLNKEKKILVELERISGSRDAGNPETKKDIHRLHQELNEDFSLSDPFQPGALDNHLLKKGEDTDKQGEANKRSSFNPFAKR